jgi:hypothetical protein
MALRINQICFFLLTILLVSVFVSFLGMTSSGVKLIDNLGTYSIQEFLREDSQERPREIE